MEKLHTGKVQKIYKFSGVLPSLIFVFIKQTLTDQIEKQWNNRFINSSPIFWDQKNPKNKQAKNPTNHLSRKSK